MKPSIIQGGQFEDERGKLSFCNDFNLSPVKRFYIIEPVDVYAVRAWQGHKVEQKWFQVLSGKFLIVLLKPENWNDIDSYFKKFEFIIGEEEMKILHVPPGFINGFKALEANSKLLIYSDLSIDAAKVDDFRFGQEKWYDWHLIK